MKDYYYLIAIICALIIFAIIHKISKKKRPVKRAFLSLLTGLITLFAVNISSVFTGVSLPYSMLSLTVALIGGIPGITALLTLNLFF